MGWHVETKLGEGYFKILDLKESEKSPRPTPRMFSSEAVAINFAKQHLELADDKFRVVEVKDDPEA